ncbi:DUF3618 domain-containing protein [Neptunicoccus sediminis]|uniref:DUF3618 domain-containing protein n=1 Tax=Neptunicoccus sediminis TaxID=1892596 RepID=UPI000845E175|nr:DUF3618 domain-containing protein [Neptunicoccus sediminis]
MPNDTRSASEIERDIERQRANLSDNIETLQDKFSIDTLVRQVGDQFREHGGDLGRSVVDQVKANPVPLALTGIGLAWMMFGNGQKREQSYRSSGYRSNDRYDSYDNRDRHAYPATRVAPHPADDYRSREDEYRQSRSRKGMPYTAPVNTLGNGDPLPSWSQDDNDDGSSYIADRAADAKDTLANARDRVADAKDQVAGSVADAKDQVSGSVSHGADKLRDSAGNLRDKVSSAAASGKSAVASGASNVQDRLSAARNRIAEGTENLTEEGRKRVIEAREKAIEMRRAATQRASEGADAAVDFYDRQPLVVGALALAVGAALGGALPRTRTEDKYVGQHSDKMFEEAERIFHEEKEKATRVAKSVQEEVKDIASETKSDLDSGAPGDKSAVEAVGDTAKSAATRVADKAKSKAKEEKLGKPNT